MRFCVLGGGSKGNATFVEAGATRILIDAGFSGKEVERRLVAIGIDPASLHAICITHEHLDHIRGAGVLSRRYQLPVLANRATVAAANGLLDNLTEAVLFETGTTVTFRDLQLHPFAISHDAADPVGFLCRANGLTLGYCTDTGIASRLIGHRLSGCHGLVLECNHDPEMLANGPYPPALKQRVRGKSGHLANAEAADLLRRLLHDQLRHVVLSHLSETNNTPGLARAAVAAMLTAAAAEEGAPVPQVSLARQDEPGEVVILREGAWNR
jgi:phosphoribosyl 1,2-cyclic phosphodiesterase